MPADADSWTESGGRLWILDRSGRPEGYGPDGDEREQARQIVAHLGLPKCVVQGSPAIAVGPGEFGAALAVGAGTVLALRRSRARGRASGQTRDALGGVLRL